LTVWNAINRQEAVSVDRYRPSQVTEVGAPQLDVYFREPSRTYSKADLGLDPSKKTLLLATSSFTYESDQTYLVDMLLEAIRSGEIRRPLQIVLRLHPDDRVGRYLKYRHAPEVILDIPERYLSTLGWTMTISDLERMAALVRHADVMVNFATTVTLEAAIVDTPTLLVAFSPIDPEEMQRYVVGLHFGMHYKALVQRDLVPIAWNRTQLIDLVNQLLDDVNLYASQRAAIVREWVQFTDGRSGQRLGDAILRAAGLEVPAESPIEEGVALYSCASG
jgi:CDP-glycerol glycerophosphotransferase (TagB/SpsB family)